MKSKIFNTKVKLRPVKSNKVLDNIKLYNKVFKNIYPLKGLKWIESFSYHIDNKDKIIEQFTDSNVVDYLNELLPNGDILYIDYFEIRSREREKWLWTNIIKKIINKANKIWLSWIYLDSYEESMSFWENNWFTVDSDIQENNNWDISNYHCSYILLNSNED